MGRMGPAVPLFPELLSAPSGVPTSLGTRSTGAANPWAPFPPASQPYRGHSLLAVIQGLALAEGSGRAVVVPVPRFAAQPLECCLVPGRPGGKSIPFPTPEEPGHGCLTALTLPYSSNHPSFVRLQSQVGVPEQSQHHRQCGSSISGAHYALLQLPLPQIRPELLGSCPATRIRCLASAFLH